MAFTPILKKLNENGTTFYTFSSAAKDLSKCMANTQKEFVFSHFVCLNIPNFINTNSSSDNNSKTCPSLLSTNYFQLGGIHDLLYRDSDANPTNEKTTSTEFAELLQDYVFNCEELLLSESEDNNTDRTVAERIFWHWLMNVGAINWKYDASKVAPSLINEQKTRFVEGADLAGYTYNPVVKYIGNIDISNNVDIANDAYTEIYIHIPSEAGNTPVVLFKQEIDDNYNTREVTENTQYILGQTEDNSSYDIIVKALYDSEPDVTPKEYIIDSTPIIFGDPVIQTQDTYTPSTGSAYKVNLLRTNLDGACIDFDTNSYSNIVLNNIANMDEFNKTGDSFEFNAVLVYYDIVDVSSQERTSNLYGILFLDDVKSDTSWDYFQRYPKYKPIEGVQNGNSYGFKLNLRIDIEPNKTGITTLVNEYNTFSMSLFGDALAKLQECADMFNITSNNITNLTSRVSDIEILMSEISNYEILSAKIEELSNSLENANLAFADRNSLLDLIANVSDKVDSIMSGRANVQLQYNTDVIHGGYNTAIDTNTPNQITINSKTGGYTLPKIYVNETEITQNSPINLNDPNRNNNNINTILNQMSNMIRIYAGNDNAEYDISIYIDSTLVNWKTGQNFKIVFPNLLLETLNQKNIIIYTGENYITTHKINYEDLLSNYPIIELTCIDNTLTATDSFVHDVLR